MSEADEDDVFVLPASFGQERLWLLDQAGAGPAYNMCGAVRLRGPLCPASLRRAFQEVAARHEVLRTSFEFAPDGSLLQVIHPGWPIPVAEHSVAERPPGLRAAAARSIIRETFEEPFGLGAGPLLRAVLVGLADEEWVLGIVVHHIVSDGWSLGILLPELAACYTAAEDGAPPDLADLPVQYGDWAVWQRRQVEDDAAGHLAYWRERLRGAPAVSLPGGNGHRTSGTWPSGTVPIEFPDPRLADVRALAKQERATPFMALLAAFSVVLARWCDQDDLVIGTVSAGRSRDELEGLIGFFVNTLPLRVPVDGDASFRTLLRDVRRTCLDAYSHQELPFEKIVEQAAADRPEGRAPLVPVMFALRNLPEIHWTVPGLVAEPFPVAAESTWLELGVELFEDGDGAMRGEATYAADSFDGAEIAALLDAWRRVLTVAAADPDRPVSRIPLAGPREHARARAESGTTPAAGSAACVHELIEAAVDAWPGQVAVVHGTDAISYRELEERANRWAWWLRAQGIGPESLVMVLLPRSVSTIVALLAVLKSGAAYLPLDPGYPPARIALLLDDARPDLVLTGDPDLFRTGPAAALDRLPPIARLDPDTGPPGHPASRPPRAARPENLAYVIYTSGSTGVPKGVMVPHAAVAHRTLRTQEARPIGPGDGSMSTNAIGFDVFGAEWIWPLISGAQVVLAGTEERHDPAAQVEAVLRHGLTVFHCTPATLEVLLAEPRIAECAGRLRRLKCGGEPLTRQLAERHFRLLPDVALDNEYGPTETAINVTSQVVRPGASRWRIPIGRPLPGVRLLVLDGQGGLLPPGMPGELYVGGAQTARGYLGRPGLTAERFVPDPFGGGRLYRTGDRVRWLPDGALEFLGRVDDQLKVRGNRIEPAEVEAVLTSHPGIDAAAVTAEGDGPADTRLVGFLGCSGTAPAIDELRAHLRARLPGPMVPERFVVLDTLPMTSSGKLDRVALRGAQGVGLHSGRTAVPPRTPVEQALAVIWAEVLKTADVGVRDDFYALGGNSMRAVRVFQRAGERGLLLPLRMMLGNHTIEQLAAQAGNDDGALGPTSRPPTT